MCTYGTEMYTLHNTTTTDLTQLENFYSSHDSDQIFNTEGLEDTNSNYWSPLHPWMTTTDCYENNSFCARGFSTRGASIPWHSDIGTGPPLAAYR